MPRRRTFVLMAVIALMAVVGAWLIVLRPLTPDPVSASPGRVSSTTSSTTASSGAAGLSAGSGDPSLPAGGGGPSTTSPSSSTASGAAAPTPSSSATARTAASSVCVAGVPARLVIPALGVNAAFQTIGLDTSAPADSQGRRPLGNPSDRTKAGWYSAGPRPGSGTGTVLANGHTYHDGSAIFKESFASRVATGQRIDVVQANGSVCSYRVQRVWRDVAKTAYPAIVSSQGLYDFSGPERLFLATCGGPFDPSVQNYDHISMVIATPIDRS